ncbi:unnamed protein product, partial [Rotaria sp. Silwood2]
MNTRRWHHTASLLADGSILITGGHTYISATNTVELYNPSTETWTYTSPMNYARRWHTATVLKNGKVLIAGGIGIDGYLDS